MPNKQRDTTIRRQPLDQNLPMLLFATLLHPGALRPRRKLLGSMETGSLEAADGLSKLA
jgi:hypothetical protein